MFQRLNVTIIKNKSSRVQFLSTTKALGVKESRVRTAEVNEATPLSNTLGKTLHLHNHSLHLLVMNGVLTLHFENAF